MASIDRAAARAAVALACLASLSCPKSKEEPADFSGTWEGSLTDTASAGGSSPTGLFLTQSGDRVTGTLGGVAAIAGKVDGNTLSFTLDFSGLCGNQAGGSATLERQSDRDRLLLGYQGASACSGTIGATGTFDRMRCPAPTTACSADWITRLAPYCADLAKDPANCGFCYGRCGDLQVCVSGHCQVPACAGPVPLEAPRAVDAGSALWSLAVADVDGDGAPDAIVSGSIAPPVAGEEYHSAILVLRNDGAGRLTAPVAADLVALFPTAQVPPEPPYVPPLLPVVPSALAVGDLDRDGRPDLVAYVGALPYPWTVRTEGEILTLLGNGDGTFRAGDRFWTGADAEHLSLGPRVIALADLDGDGVLDLVARSGDAPAVQVRRGAGDGTFGDKAEYPLVGAVRALAVADVDGDGVLDLVVACEDYQSYGVGPVVSVLPGNGDGTFRAHVDSRGVPFAQDVAVADLDGDGIPDVVLLPTVAALTGNGDGTFDAPRPVADERASAGWSLAVADLDADGRLDLAVGDSDVGVELFLGRGDGTFSWFEQPSRAGAGFVVPADVDRDGRIDLVAADLGGSGDVVVLRACGP